MAVPRFKLKVAAVHAAPVYMDKQATTAKAVQIIKDAGEQGIKLLAFPETFIPGYPVRTCWHSHPPPLSQTHLPKHNIKRRKTLNQPRLYSTSSKPTHP